MARLRWASGIAVVALTVTACGMGGDDSGTNNGSGDGEGSGGGNVVYAEFTPPRRRVGRRRPTTAILLSRAGCLETLVRYEADGTLEPRTWQPRGSRPIPRRGSSRCARV